MSDDYRQVSDALASGAAPGRLCETCPWDRYCVTPPNMSTKDVEDKLKEAEHKDDERMTQKGGMPVSMILSALVYASKDVEARVCPVFALRLRSSGGRKIAETVKTSMKGWDDDGFT